jgi:hypothetical protein
MAVEAALKVHVAVARLGVAELRDKQREAIESFVSGKLNDICPNQSNR